MAHQKYLMFIECSRKVAEKNSENPMNGTTDILNELLADEVWLAQVRHFSFLHQYFPIRREKYKIKWLIRLLSFAALQKCSLYLGGD